MTLIPMEGISMTRMAWLLILVLLPRLVVAQTVPDNGGQSPTMVRAAGMPLNDGALAPGMLTVRVVQGAFTHDLAGQAVDVEVTGAKTARAMTGSDGRAQFAHLPVGAAVRAIAIVGDERLESDVFPMPEASGVRLLLVAGGGSADAGAAGLPNPSGFTTVVDPPLAATLPVEPPQDPESGVLAIRIGLVLATVFAFALFTLQRRRRRS
jgi:hypothetical protein